MKVTRRTVAAHGRNVRIVYLTCNWCERRAIRKLIAAGRTNLLEVSAYPAGLTFGVHFLVKPKGYVQPIPKLARSRPRWLTVVVGRRFNWIDITALSVAAITLHDWPVSTIIALGISSGISIYFDKKIMREGGSK